jgi:hypothetical protein
MVPARQARHDDRENENHNEDFQSNYVCRLGLVTPMHVVLTVSGLMTMRNYNSPCTFYTRPILGVHLN